MGDPTQHGENVEPCLRPRPGPLHWDWRCLACSHAIADHLPWWQRLLARWRRSTKEEQR